MQQDSIHYWHHPSIPDIEISQGQFQHFKFNKHIHLDYHLGLISQGGQRYTHKGQSNYVNNRILSTLNPDETHDGESIEETGYTANVIAFPVHFIEQIAKELNVSQCYFHQATIKDPYICQGFLYLHQLLIQSKQDTATSQLEKETTTLAFITELMLRHSQQKPTQNVTHHALSAAQLSNLKELFYHNLSEPLKLQQLAEHIGLSQFQLLRQFKQATGMTPHAYITRIRLEQAKKSLLKGETPTHIAHAMGFFDQSHFNKSFKNAFLTTPSQFQRQLSPHK